MGQCAVFCLLQHVMHIFTPCPFAGAVFHYKKNGEIWWWKDKGSACHTFSLGTWVACTTQVKKNSLLKKYPCSGAEAVPLMSSLVLARRPLRPLLSIMTRHCDQNPQNKSCSSKANISERFSYSCFTEHEMELKGNIKWVIKLKTWCLVIFSWNCPYYMHI